METRVFCIPSLTSPDCRRIWIEAALPDYASLTEIRVAMEVWLRHFCDIDYSLPDRPFVRWKTITGTRHECYADTFMRWLLCACKEMPALKPEILVEEEEKLEQVMHIKEPIYSITEEDIEKILSGDEAEEET